VWVDGTAQLKQALRAGQFFTLSFGLIIGIAWIVMLGQWLNAAGPLGAILGFIGGGIVMMLIALCYAEVGTMLPVDGGELAYAYEIFGIESAYLVGWFLALAYAGIAAFEAISAGWLLGIIVPALRGPVLYTISGEPVRLGPVVVGVAGMFCITTLNYIGIEFAAALQDIFAYGKIALAVVFFSAAIIVGKTAHMRPLFQETATGTIAWSGVFAVMTTAPFWYGGFNAIPQVMEEKAGRTALNTVGRVMMLSLTVGIVFYCVVIAATSMAAPWRNLVSQEMATVAAFRIAFQSPVWANLVLIAGFCGIITAWNAVFIAASRVLFSLGRARVISSVFGAVHPLYRSPSVAILFVGAVGLVSVFLGRTAISPIANLGSSCFAFAYLVTSFGMLRLRYTRPNAARPYRAPGGVLTAGVAAVGSLFMLVMSLYQPYAAAKPSLPLEWKLLTVWALLGVAFWVSARRIRGQITEADRHRVMVGPLPSAEKLP
jgi:basic amino acid/polyamine antiporter, APA family